MKLKYILKLAAICIISTTLSIMMNHVGIGKENTLMIFLVGVLIVASVTKGYIYGAVASVLCVMLFNFFFTEPFYTLVISYNRDYILIVFFLIASLITSTMTSKLQYQTEIAQRNEQTSLFLYKISKEFSSVIGKENIIKKGIKYINDYIGCECIVKLDSDDNIFTASEVLNYEDINKPDIYQIPIKGVANKIGILKIVDIKSPISKENDMIVKTIVYQMALVLDREFIYNEREKIKIAMEKEQLKSTLLRSVSHDLRTPLTGIKGSSDLLLENYDSLDNDSIKKLIFDISEESIWLIKTIQNILDMTRISEGGLTVNKVYEAVDDLISQALSHISHVTNSKRLHVTVPDDIILVMVDGRLIVQVLVNLLDNAFKHSGHESQIYLKAYRNGNNVIFEISDDGKGIDNNIKDSIFDEFVTHHYDIADSSRGVGLGLSICKAIVNAHNGEITAENQETGGALFKIVLPLEEK
ncbi:MAG: integral rane sensor signal transduction histidine kinase [Bacillota bacterium]|nr:integral rane sensor signal transduction histidine kinase [Bacillota bacterium]